MDVYKYIKKSSEILMDKVKFFKVIQKFSLKIYSDKFFFKHALPTYIRQLPGFHNFQYYVSNLYNKETERELFTVVNIYLNSVTEVYSRF